MSRQICVNPIIPASRLFHEYALILRDLRDHPGDKRHGLFIVGWMHATKNLTLPGGEPIKSAGWRLQEALGATNVLTVFPHCPVMANRGDVNGRASAGPV